MNGNIHSMISCIILAGGEGKRVDYSDKGLINFHNKPLVAHVIASIESQVDDIVISANRNIDQYKRFSPTVISDLSGRHGPLAGIAAALPACQHDLVLIVPCDMPSLPDDLVSKLLTSLGDNEIAIVDIENHFQLVFLMRRSLLACVQQHMSSEKYKLMQWVKSCSYVAINFDDSTDCFINMNSKTDLI